MHKVRVSLASRSYEISIGAGLLAKVGPGCARLRLGRRCAVISDSNVAPLFAKEVLTSLRDSGHEPILITVPAGEKSKSVAALGRCLNELASHRLERKSFLVALGGGVVGDLAGFVAATYLRGIPFVQAPTTLLAQVDSSVGGKTGVNLPAGKNLAGAFYQPRHVFCDLDTLTRLPRRDYVSGIAEVVKYGVIYDAAFFRSLESSISALLRRDPAMLGRVVRRCCEIKADVVSKDENESGLRAILNFGHTLGHAIENGFGYGKYLHGEAISIGQVAAARLSCEVMGLPERDATRIESLLRAAGLPVQVKLSASQRKKLFEAMLLDKKVSQGEVRFVLAKKIGEVTWGCRVQQEQIDAVMDSIS